LFFGWWTPVAVGREGAGFRNDIGEAKITRVANDALEMFEPSLPFVLVRVNDILISGYAANRQVVVAKDSAYCPARFLCDPPARQIHVLESEVELDSVEVESPDALRRFLQAVGKIPVKMPWIMFVSCFL
jgi:hypothetical protein